MSLSSIVQIADRLLNGDFGQNSETQAKNKTAQGTQQAQTNRTEFGDRFTRSEQPGAANAAGGTGQLQIEQLRFTALNIQTPAGNAAAPGPVPTAVNAGLNTGGTVPAANTAAPANTPAPTAVQTAAPAGTTPGTTQTQADLQSLNSSLAALGLNAAEIAAFDQFASILLQSDPNALQDLENQLNLLAAQYQTQGAPATSAATPATQSAATGAAAPASGTAAVAPAPAASPGFQLSELSISFTGLNGTLSQSGKNGGNAAPVQFSAFNLQIQEVNVTLTNAAGQTAQVKVPQAGTGTTAAAAKAATA